MKSTINVKEVKLEKLAIAVSEYVSRNTPEEHDYRLTALAEYVGKNLLFNLRQYIWSEQLGTVEINHPRTWFEMLKRDHAPKWFIRRFPVRYKTEVYNAKALYPYISFQSEKHTVVLIKTEEDHDNEWYKSIRRG